MLVICHSIFQVQQAAMADVNSVNCQAKLQAEPQQDLANPDLPGLLQACMVSILQTGAIAS